ncbi:MAG: hypothetical protein GY832_04265 [Chloroflexi bacterium]|nr:hypothetical protein [Chloroflexota bacterium]
MSITRSELESKSRSAVLQHAFFRLENALVLAGTIVLTALFNRPFSWWPVWGWPLLGFLGATVLFYTSLTDAGTNARVMLEFYRQAFDPDKIQDQALRREIELALEVQRTIEEQMRKERGALRKWLADTANLFGEWIGNVYQLALQLDVHRRGELLPQEQKAVPQQVEELSARRRLEQDPVIRRELNAALEAKGKQWQALRDLDTRMNQVELDLKASLAALSSIYSQVELMDDGDIDSGQADLLEVDIRKQVDDLNSLVGSIDNSIRQYQKISNTTSSFSI